MPTHDDDRGGRVLLVDDDPAFRSVFRAVLEGEGHEVVEAADRDGAREAIVDPAVAVVLLDLMLPPDGSVRGGLAQLREILAARPGVKVVVVSGAGDLSSMLEAVRAGAHDFLTKPADPDVVAVVVSRALSRHRLERRVASLQESLARAQPTGAMIGRSPAFLAALRLAERVAASDLPLLVLGESGTGKELLARFVHERSPRRDGPFVAQNCGAIPETLVESTLFGHRKGAFTGADRDRRGIFVEADGGTLLLDEVADLSPGGQVAVLRALEAGEVRPVGADRPTRVDVRVVSATHRDPAAMVAAGELREDLYWRLRGAEVTLPPLRDRAADLDLLAACFLAQAASLAADGRPKALDDGARRALLEHAWPGNLRELRHEMQRATVLAGERTTITRDDLSLPSPSSPLGGSDRPVTLREQVEALERRAIEAALAAAEGNRTHAAEALGLSRQGLLNKMSRYGLDRDD